MFKPVRARKGVLAAVSAVALIGLAACESDYGPSRYSPYEAGVPARVEHGRIASFRPVRFTDGDTGGATAVGAVGGGIAGSVIGGGRHGGSLAGGLVGALVGGVLGHEIARSGDVDGFAYIVNMPGGRTIEVPQPDRYPIQPGTRVDVIFGPRVRVVPAGGGYAPPPPPRY